MSSDRFCCVSPLVTCSLSCSCLLPPLIGCRNMATRCCSLIFLCKSRLCSRLHSAKSTSAPRVSPLQGAKLRRTSLLTPERENLWRNNPGMPFDPTFLHRVGHLKGLKWTDVSLIKTRAIYFIHLCSMKSCPFMDPTAGLTLSGCWRVMSQQPLCFHLQPCLLWIIFNTHTCRSPLPACRQNNCPSCHQHPVSSRTNRQHFI